MHSNVQPSLRISHTCQLYIFFLWKTLSFTWLLLMLSQMIQSGWCSSFSKEVATWGRHSPQLCGEGKRKTSHLGKMHFFLMSNRSKKVTWIKQEKILSMCRNTFELATFSSNKCLLKGKPWSLSTDCKIHLHVNYTKLSLHDILTVHNFIFFIHLTTYCVTRLPWLVWIGGETTADRADEDSDWAAVLTCCGG